MPLENRVLEILNSRRGHPVSCAELSDALGAPCSAIRAAVDALRADGRNIAVSADRNEFRLEPDAGSDILTAGRISSLLPNEYRALPVFVYGSIDSTNNEAKRRLADGSLVPPALIVAAAQTAGRGRQGRSFYSPANTGLYMSLAVRAGADAADAVSLTTMAAVAAAMAIEDLSPLRPAIKWVNDIYVGGRKVCGILAEAVGSLGSGDANVVIGIGVNLSTVDFPDELAGRAASLNAGITRSALAAGITARLLKFSENLSDRSYIEDYRARSLVLGRDITFTRSNRTYAARAVAIDERGGLEVVLPDGTHEILQSGEISVRLNDQSVD